MEKTPHQPEPAAWPAIEQAFETARQLPVWKHAPMKVGICLRDGSVAATAELEDWRQFRLFSIHLEAMGYENEQGEGGRSWGCDVLFRPCGVHPLGAAAA